MYKRVILIVLDSVGIGALPDAGLYGDEGSNTICNIAGRVPLNIPNMVSLGLGNIEGAYNLPKSASPKGAYGRAAEKSAGKDTTTGHWEIAGVILEKPFPTFPHGFPQSLMSEFERRIGVKTLGNKPASGTEIIKELGDEHVRTGYPIVYTSADSVFQIAAHEDVIPVDRLYEICRCAREMLTGEFGVGRVIARPFEGSSGNYKRTERRRDFSLSPVKPTMLDYIKSAGLDVKAVGKIEDIFANRGITDSVHTTNNRDGIAQTVKYIAAQSSGLIFTNLVDFDMLYGHRNNVEGYAEALEEFDSALPGIEGRMKDGDLLFITADHGCDPTTPSTDHSREYIPVLVYGKGIKPSPLGTLTTFADIGKTICDILGVQNRLEGASFRDRLL